MKILGFVLGFLLITTFAFADVKAVVLDCSQDTNGSIIVKTQYKIDNVEVVSRYPQQDGKYYWVTRYNISSFAGMTDLQVKNRILLDLKQFGESLITQTYLGKANFEFTQTKADKLIGTTGTITTADILVDTNGDGIVDTNWVVKTDGTKTDIPYIPTP